MVIMGTTVAKTMTVSMGLKDSMNTVTTTIFTM